jgi:adenylate cyclase
LAGQADIAIERIEASLRLSPRARIGWGLVAIGAAHFVRRRFDEAVPNLLLAIQEDPDYPAPYRFLAATYAHMGRLDEAQDVIRRLRTISPVVVPPNPQFRNPEHRALLLSGLRKAGMPEE